MNAVYILKSRTDMLSLVYLFHKEASAGGNQPELCEHKPLLGNAHHEKAWKELSYLGKEDKVFYRAVARVGQ